MPSHYLNFSFRTKTNALRISLRLSAIKQATTSNKHSKNTPTNHTKEHFPRRNSQFHSETNANQERHPAMIYQDINNAIWPFILRPPIFHFEKTPITVNSGRDNGYIRSSNIATDNYALCRSLGSNYVEVLLRGCRVLYASKLSHLLIASMLVVCFS